jgi:hypothetical protein
MSTLQVFAAICAVEQAVEAIFYHSRRDWERMHLQWKQHTEEIKRSGRGRPYAEPVMRSMEQIRKECYSGFLC